MDLGLQGKGALVMSSSRGLGLGIAELLASEGCNVLLTGRSEDRLAAAVDAMNAKSAGHVAYTVTELGDPACVDQLARAAEEALGQVDFRINNTGGPPPGLPAISTRWFRA